MPYDYKNLSPLDFENLVRDLLQAEWKMTLEAFKNGRDSGIDLRYSRPFSDSIIIQCKHFQGSTYSGLRSKLKNEELEKIKKLNPTRYVVATSLGLSPSNKAEIRSDLAPFIVSDSDIYGANDLDSLLSRHSDVERRHFKLWLTSTEVMERVLHNAQLCQTDFKVEAISRKLPIFVQNNAYPRARKILDDSHVCVISGAPGIGKTTLADILLYTLLNEGYEPISIEGDISDGKEVFRASAKRVYYFDDFLGRTFLGDRPDYLGRNQDVALINFMEMVQTAKDAKFILTTREHILGSARLLSDKLAHSSALENRCILELSDYSIGDRARILYNHLYFSDLPSDYKAAVLQDDFFLTIIKHKHFNPRLIEWLSSYSRVIKVDPSKYKSYISELLRSPNEIWSHAFRRQISDAARHLLVTLYTLGELSDVDDLQPVFASYHRHCSVKYNRKSDPSDFRDATKELENSFLNYNSNRAGFLNPSVREYTANIIAENREIVSDIVASAVRFKQIVNMLRLAAAKPSSEMEKYITDNKADVRAAFARLLYVPDVRWETVHGSRRGYSIDMSYERKLSYLIEVMETDKSLDVAGLALQLINALVVKSITHVPDFSDWIDLVDGMTANDWFMQNGGSDACGQFIDCIFQNLIFARASDWIKLFELSTKEYWSESEELKLNQAFERYQSSGVRDEQSECSTLDEMESLRDALQELTQSFGFDFTKDVKRVEEAIDEGGAREEYDRGDDYRGRPSGSERLDITSESDIRDMFHTLRS